MKSFIGLMTGAGIAVYVAVDAVSVLAMQSVIDGQVLANTEFLWNIGLLIGAGFLVFKAGKAFGAWGTLAVDLVKRVEDLECWRAVAEPIITDWQVRTGIERKEIG